jgi:iron complex transport system ATP-binding protein
VASGLGFRYPGGGWVFRGLDLSVGEGAVTAVLGPNGCGKTTLLRLLTGTLKPSEGRAARRGEAALVPQLFQVAFSFTALDMVLMGRARSVPLFSRPSGRDVGMALGAMEEMGVADLAGRAFTELSGGQRQLVMLSRALVSEASILFLDEPASALDLAHQGLLVRRIRALSRDRGLTVVFSTHLPAHALAAADEAVLMRSDGGRVSGPAAEVLTEERLSEAYGAPIRRVTLMHGGREVEALVPILAGR